MNSIMKSPAKASRREFVIDLSMCTAMMAAAGRLEAQQSAPTSEAQGGKKYAKYIVLARPFQPAPPKAARGGDLGKLVTPKLHMLMGINSAVAEGSIMMNCSWVYVGEDPGKMSAHSHPYPEIIGFVGGDPKDADNLGGEGEVWMEDEQYLFNKSCLIYVPKGVRHGPIVIKNITRNIFHFDIQITTGEFRAQPLG
jgi:hypothetical protein